MRCFAKPLKDSSLNCPPQAVIVQVDTDEHSHLVAIVKGQFCIDEIDQFAQFCLRVVPGAEEKQEEGVSPWYIFNDFVVRNVPEHEALSFPGKWKVNQFPICWVVLAENLSFPQVPAILHFERIDRNETIDLSKLCW